MSVVFNCFEHDTMLKSRFFSRSWSVLSAVDVQVKDYIKKQEQNIFWTFQNNLLGSIFIAPPVI